MTNSKLLTPLLILFITIQACTSSNQQSTTTHVKELVQSDVFEVLPEWYEEIVVYESADDIEGEYFELAAIEVKDVRNALSDDRILKRLKNEAEALGGNGVLLVHKSKKEKGGLITEEVKAMAIYSLQVIIDANQLAYLN